MLPLFYDDKKFIVTVEDHHRGVDVVTWSVDNEGVGRITGKGEGANVIFFHPDGAVNLNYIDADGVERSFRKFIFNRK